MAVLPIVNYPDSRLRVRSEEIEAITPEILKLLDNMLETMYAAPGIGLAAPQVGVSLRAIVLDVGEEDTERKSPLKLINPVIIESSGNSKMEEGCLSIPDIRETVSRPARVKIKALDHKGQLLEIEAEGLLATCLQHEIDHLNGILFIDRLSKIRRQLVEGKLKKLRK